MGADDKKPRIKILQVSNISVTASKDQIYTMLQYIGRIDDIKIYPTDINITSSTTQKVAFVKYDDDRSVEVGQHLTNTVLIDRAVVCTPWPQPTIPDESTFMNSGGVTMAGQRQLPPHVSNKTQVDADGVSMLLTVDPTLEQLGLPSYPLLPGDTDPAKVEEIRRTVYVGNLPKGTEGQTVSDFFNSYIGEVMYVRMAAGPETLPCAYAYVEFSQQTTVPIALQNSGIEFQGRLLKIQHSRVAIIKPQQKTADQALEEVEEAIRMGKTGDAPPAAASASRRSRTRSPRRRRSRSRDKERDRSRRRSKSKEKKRSRSREKKRSRSRERDTKRRSRSRDRRARRSRSRDRRERSKSRDRKRSRSKSRDRKRSRSRDRKRERDRKERRRSRSRSKDRSDRKKDRRDRSSDRRRSTKDKERKEKDVDKQSVEDKEEKLRDKLLEKAAARNGNTDGSTSDLDMEDQKVDKKPSKIKNERKRHLSDSD